MCQLLGMNCNVPTDIVFSFEGFRRRGGETDEHADGWGIAFFEDGGCRVFLDYLPSSISPVADLVKNYPIQSRNVIAHIRKATQGTVSLANTHPFQRELWGRYWLFAHNGNLAERPGLDGGRFTPVGSTDSEHAFCALLNELSQRYSEPPGLAQLHQAVAEFAGSLSRSGTFNFLLSDGRALFAHCSTDLFYVVRESPFSTAHLSDADVSIDFARVTTPRDRVAVIATRPLTDNEAWQQMRSGELLCFVDGMPHPTPA
ncbi:class II glutamine amidotransferase [Chitiniphilus shinanonensis]|uniref:Class II glutamine amidotransferase n=1 Tax=Chitiniphilus shinanonensis TaxID=553088 RepID=A0ABQ6BZJ7_9NEIS|nr:class II glutamine amidotransferase [Chitiniphilus shinanonensis]GLS05328.1 class II glutamine amidotransferase [Chitiniphilus shinanonensis]